MAGSPGTTASRPAHARQAFGFADQERRPVSTKRDRGTIGRDGSSAKRTPCSTSTGSGPVVRVVQARCPRPGHRRSPRSVADQLVHRLHVQRSARPRWTPLTIASSAARSFVSASSRCRLVEQARVLEGHAHARSERRRAGVRRLRLKASSRGSPNPTTPIIRSPLVIGTPSHNSVSDPPSGSRPAPSPPRRTRTASGDGIG